MKKSAAPDKARKKKKSSVWSTLLLLVILLVGVAILAYPTVSDWWNSYHQTIAVANYISAVNDAPDEKIDEMMERARAYNASLLRKDDFFTMTEEDEANYRALLDLTGNGIMGYIEIGAIDVKLPIYHTTEESVLQIAVGHIEWSSLPIGGESTHCLLSGHRGLPSARLFTDLDRLKEGDIFTVTVLRQTITYQIDQIRIVEPHEISMLGPVFGQDLCTLITCTPYGINTHRMLVRGHQVTPDDGPTAIVTADAVRIPNYISIPAIGIPLLFISLLVALIRSSRRRHALTAEDLWRSGEHGDGDDDPALSEPSEELMEETPENESSNISQQTHEGKEPTP